MKPGNLPAKSQLLLQLILVLCEYVTVWFPTILAGDFIISLPSLHVLFLSFFQQMLNEWLFYTRYFARHWWLIKAKADMAAHGSAQLKRFSSIESSWDGLCAYHLSRGHREDGWSMGVYHGGNGLSTSIRCISIGGDARSRETNQNFKGNSYSL